jgi:hypothetical protein
VAAQNGQVDVVRVLVVVGAEVVAQASKGSRATALAGEKRLTLTSPCTREPWPGCGWMMWRL